jgi:primosomal protein N' (replication factor Y)
MLVGGFARTAEGEQLIRTGWAEELTPARETVRAAGPRIAVAGATVHELARDPFARTARLPKEAHEVIRTCLESGPVLVQNPRHGYASALACDTCRDPAQCPVCRGPLHQPAAHRPPTCRWCGAEQHHWSCPECGGRGLRAPVLGDRRTAEELGRAFPRIPVRTSSGDHVLASVDAVPSIVVATPGAEPLVEGGYAGVLLLDAMQMLARPDLRTAEESLRRWLNAASLARPAAIGGRVLVVGDPADPTLQALVRWDPTGFAGRELLDRASAHLPPASRLATVSGPVDVVSSSLDQLAELGLPPGAEVLGPVPHRAAEPGEVPQVRAVVRVPRPSGSALSRTLVEMQGVRSARKQGAVRVQVDPVSLD